MSLLYTVLNFLLFFLIFINISFAENSQKGFNDWLINYKKYALTKNISQKTIDLAFQNVQYLEQVIKYDRKQPEFFEDTNTYVSKRANNIRLNKAKKLLSQNRKLFNEVEDNFFVEKEILLALWGIETNFGKHVGKINIISFTWFQLVYSKILVFRSKKCALEKQWLHPKELPLGITMKHSFL